jgi:two-component system, sensor histidine kinase
MAKRRARPPAKGSARRASRPGTTRKVTRRKVTPREVAASRKPSAPKRKPTTAAAQAVEKALAAFAHDVRTPLTGIMALSELLTTSNLGERERRWVAALKSSAEHLVALTTLVVDATRADVHGIVLRDEVFDLRAFAETMAESMTARAQAKGLAVAVDLDDALPSAVVGDPVRLRNAIENLIDNAVKFTEKGTISLAVTAKPARGRRVHVVIAIADSGLGMTAQEAKRILRPFAQANDAIARKFGGAGLGLAMVKRLAEAMGGDLTLASQPGRGSRFTLSVDLAISKAQPGRVLPGGLDAVAGRARRILGVEDNPYGRVILSTILKELGHDVDFVGTGEAAVSAVAGGRYDLVLMDVTLPGGNGIDATRRIRTLADPLARIPVIGISGLSSSDEEAQARAAGMNDYLAKPVSPSRLAKAIAAAP